MVTVLCEKDRISNSDEDKNDVMSRIQRYGNDVNANMSDVTACGLYFGCLIERVPAVQGQHGVKSVLQLDDGTYLIVWKYDHIDNVRSQSRRNTCRRSWQTSES